MANALHLRERRRGKRAKIRDARKQLTILKSPSPSSSRCSTPATATSPTPSFDQEGSFTTGIGEQLFTGYQVHELPHVSKEDSGQSTSQLGASGNSEVVVNMALLARIEVLEAENQHIKTQLQMQHQYFRMSQVTVID